MPQSHCWVGSAGCSVWSGCWAQAVASHSPVSGIRPAGDHRHRLLAGGPGGRVMAAGVVRGLLEGVGVVVPGVLRVGCPLTGGPGGLRGVLARHAPEEGVGREGAGGVVAGAVVGGVVAAVGGDVPVRSLLAAVRRVGRRGGIGGRSRGHGPRRVTVVHQLLFRLDNRGCQSSAATVPGGMRARQSSPGFAIAGNGHSVGFWRSAGAVLALCSTDVRNSDARASASRPSLTDVVRLWM